MLKPGYSPEEQCRPKGHVGPWTDIYALAATMYKCITGITPDDALQRLSSAKDPLVWPSQLGIEIDPVQEEALKRGMAIRARDRFQSIGHMKAFLHGERNGTHAENGQGKANTHAKTTPVSGISGRNERQGEVPHPSQDTTGHVTYMPIQQGAGGGAGRRSKSGRPAGKRRVALVATAATALALITGGVFALAAGGDSHGHAEAIVQPAPQVTASSYEGTYDGEPHSAKIALADGTDATVCYSESTLDYENYQAAPPK